MDIGAFRVVFVFVVVEKVGLLETTGPDEGLKRLRLFIIHIR